MDHLDPKLLGFVIYMGLRMHQFQKYHLLPIHLLKRGLATAINLQTPRFYVSTHISFFYFFNKVVRQLSQESGMGDYESEVDENELDLDGKPEVSNEKLENLVKRQKVYGDITQNASPEELETLLRYHENKVPEVSIFHNMYSLLVH